MEETAARCHKSSQTRPPLPTDHLDRHTEMPSTPPSCLFEELFCTSQTSSALVPLAGALLTSFRPQSDVAKEGYLGKLDRNHRRYFVLRAGSHTGPSRLEWYKSQEKFTAMESAGKAALFGSSKQGVIYLRCCLGVSRIGSTRRGHTVAVYARDQTMVLVVKDQGEQEEWYQAIKKLMEEEQPDEERGEGIDEEDDGYCTLPPAAFFKEVWPVTVKPRGLGSSKSLAGESRLCLTASSLILVRVSACSDAPSVTIPLLSVRRFGHLEGSFFLELGRSAPNGPGEIWMEAKDQGGPAVAQRIHEEVRDTVKSLRPLPDFSRSPTHGRPQTLLASKHCRPKYRDKRVNVRRLGSGLPLPPRNAKIHSKQSETHQLEPASPLSSVSEADNYVEMKVDSPLISKGQENDCSVPACGMEGWESAEEEERLGYMMMSPQGSHRSSGLPQDDYIPMRSPRKHEWQAGSSPQASFSSAASGSCQSLQTPVRPSETDSVQSRMSVSPARPHPSAAWERISGVQRRRTTCSPGRTLDASGLTPPFAATGPAHIRPVLASPQSAAIRSRRARAASDRSAKICRLSLCLPCCVQAEDGS